MRAITIALTAIALVVAPSFTVQAHGRGGPPPPRHEHYAKDEHKGGQDHHGHGLICEKVVVYIPKWTFASWGRGSHGHHITYIKKVVVICHRPCSY